MNEEFICSGCGVKILTTECFMPGRNGYAHIGCHNPVVGFGIDKIGKIVAQQRKKVEDERKRANP